MGGKTREPPETYRPGTLRHATMSKRPVSNKGKSQEWHPGLFSDTYAVAHTCPHLDEYIHMGVGQVDITPQVIRTHDHDLTDRPPASLITELQEGWTLKPMSCEQ